MTKHIEQVKKAVEDIQDAIIREHHEHETCDYDIGCIVYSDPLVKRLTKIVTQSEERGEKREGEALGFRECIICKKVKPFSDFYLKKSNNPSIDYRCKVCHTIKATLRLRDTYSLEKGHKRYLLRKSRGGHIATFRKMTEKYPEKYKARYMLRNAIKLGKVRKGVCEVCGDIKSTAHHEDYSRPFEVRWLCKKHHGLITRKNLSQKSTKQK